MAESLGRVDYGNTPFVYATFTDETGTLANPTAVTVITRSPAGTETSVSTPNAAITNPSTGVWKFVFPSAVTVAGTWYVRFKGTSGVLAVQESSFEVETSAYTSP